MLASLFFNLRALQFSVIIKPLFESFKGVVSSSSLEELHRTALCWLDEHCSLPVLRPSEWGCVGWTRAGLPKTQALLQVTRRQLGQGGEAEPEAPLQGGGQGLPEPLLNFLPPPCAPLIDLQVEINSETAFETVPVHSAIGIFLLKSNTMFHFSTKTQEVNN